MVSWENDSGQGNKLNLVWKRRQGVQEKNHQSGNNNIQTVKREGERGGNRERGGYHDSSLAGEKENICINYLIFTI